MFVAIVRVLIYRLFSLPFGYILPFTSSVVDRCGNAKALLMLALIGKLVLKGVWDSSYSGYFGNTIIT